jgi:vitamin B12 transporter
MRNAHCAFAMTCALATAGVGMSAATAVAQEAVLPPVVVEGATLEAKPKAQPSQNSAPKPSQSQPQNQVSGEPVPQSSGEGVQPGPSSSAAGSTDAAGSGGVEARKIGVPVSVVTGAELKARQIRNAVDALRSLPGVSVSRLGGGGNQSQVRIRGAEANQTLVIIDGVEANDTNGGEFDFSNLSADDIERIEVIRGGQSGLYGSRAIGGVINIVTRGGRGPLTFRGYAEGGSFNTGAVGASVSAGNDAGYFAAGFNRLRTDGFDLDPFGSEDDGFERTTFNLRTGASIVQGISVDFNLRRTATVSDFDAFDTNGAFVTARDAANISDATVWLGGGKITWDMFNGGLTHVIGGTFNYSTFESFDKTDPGIFDNALYDNERERLYYLATARFGATDAFRHIVTGLVEKEDESFTPQAFFSDNLERTRNRTAYAAEYRGEFLDRIFPLASIRHEDNDTFDDFTTWKTALSVDLREVRMRPHASAGTAVALPGMFEQFGTILGTFVGNPNLVPEESFGWDAGVEFTIVPGLATVDVTYFEADLQNEIIGFGNSLINLLGESERRGIEVSSRAEIAKGLVVGAAYTWLDASDPSGLAELRRPENSARVDLNYTFDEGRGNLNLETIYTGEAIDNRFAAMFASVDRVELDAYWLVNAAASYKLMPGMELYGRVENLLDEDYQEVFGFETAGAAAYVGLRFTYVEEATRAWAEGR